MSNDIYWKQPGVRRHWIVAPNGSIVSDVSTQGAWQYVIRTTGVGYVGRFPKEKPLPLHAYRFNVQRINIQNDAEYKYTNGYKEYFNGAGLNSDVNGANFLPAFDWTPLYNRAVAKLNDASRGDLDISIDLAETGKTLKMLHVQNQILDFTTAFKRRFGPLKAAGNAWLMWRYGIRPTLKTLFDAADENLNVVLSKSQRYKVRVTDRYFPSVMQINSIVGLVSFPVVKGSSVKVSISLGADIRTDKWDAARWSTLNPLGIAWELLPFSFVADWFLNIGGYLRDMETYLLYSNKFRSGYRTDFSRVEKLGLESIDKGVGPGEIGHTSRWYGTYSGVYINRTILHDYPIPSLPKLKANLGSFQLLSGAALLAQLLSSGGNPIKHASKAASKAVQDNVRLFQSGKPAKVFTFPPNNYHF